MAYRAKAKMITRDGERWYSAEGVAEQLGGVHITQAYALMRDGKIVATKQYDKVFRASHAAIAAYKVRRKWWRGLHGQGPKSRTPEEVAVG